MSLVVLGILAGAGPVDAQTYKVLYSFAGPTSDGANPSSALVKAGGKLYGTTRYGGSFVDSNCAIGCGTVFSLTRKGVEKVLYNFDGSRANGGLPQFGLVKGSSGSFYGVTPNAVGVVYKIDAAGNYSVLYQFTGDPAQDGYAPVGVLARDSAGNLYGTSLGGGGLGKRGTVFRVDPVGNHIILYTFTGGADGADPDTGVIRDGKGNLYGSTNGGGAFNQGVIFKLTPGGAQTVLYNFTGGTDGTHPKGLIGDSAKNLYGVTDGTVFKLDPGGTLTVLYTFTGASDGFLPKGSLVRDSAGNLYGVTLFGGNGNGVVFKVDTAGHETVLHTFAGGPSDGALPQGGLLRDGKGRLYGTTSLGGATGNGVVYQISP